MLILAKLLVSPGSRWLAVAVLVAALSGYATSQTRALRTERADHAETARQRGVWNDAYKQCVSNGTVLRERNTALATAAATQCGTGQASAFERGRAFGHAEASQ